MNTILYAKYSRDRNPVFQIRTSILKDGERKWVEKAPVTKEAERHVQKLARSYQELQRQYADTPLKISPCRMEHTSAIFDFIEGEPLTAVLQKMVEAADEEKLMHLCVGLAELVRSRRDLRPFIKTPEFIKVYGDISFPDGLVAGDYNNVDMITDNFIVSGQTLTLLDYEWCFDFPVPMEYILFRMFFFSFEKWHCEDYVLKRLLPLLGIHEQAITAFQKMEEAFRVYVYHDAFRIEDAYYSIRGITYPFAMLHDAESKRGQLTQQVEQAAQTIDALLEEKAQMEQQVANVSQEKERIEGELAAVSAEKKRTEDELAAVSAEKERTENELAVVLAKKAEFEANLAAARQEQCEEHRRHAALLLQHEARGSELALYKNEFEARKQYLAQHRIKAAVKACFGILWQE